MMFSGAKSNGVNARCCPDTSRRIASAANSCTTSGTETSAAATNRSPTVIAAVSMCSRYLLKLRRWECFDSMRVNSTRKSDSLSAVPACIFPIARPNERSNSTRCFGVDPMSSSANVSPSPASVMTRIFFSTS